MPMTKNILAMIFAFFVIFYFDFVPPHSNSLPPGERTLFFFPLPQEEGRAGIQRGFTPAGIWGTG
jgi:hypothetical protein